MRSVKTTGKINLLPPSQEELWQYKERNLNWLRIPSLFSFGCLMYSQVKFALEAPWLWVLLPFVAFTLIYYLISQIVTLGTKDFQWEIKPKDKHSQEHSHEAVMRWWEHAREPGGSLFGVPRPHLAIWLPICKEPAEVLRETWMYAIELAKEYRRMGGVCNIYVGDDGDDERASQLAEGFARSGLHYLVRPNRGEDKKSGNLLFLFNEAHKAAHRTRGEDIIKIYDADFCPSTRALFDIAYLEKYPDVGIVQTPQFFRTEGGANWLQNAAGAVQRLFYCCVQVTRNNHGSAICVGTNGTYRRTALASIGGSARKLSSEDVWTGVKLRKPGRRTPDSGWRLIYVPLNVAVGLCPADVGSFLAQQYRWCEGSAGGLMISKEFWQTEMNFVSRLCYISGFCYYIHTAAMLLLAPVVPIILALLLPQNVNLVNYLWIVPSLIYNFVIFPGWHKGHYNWLEGMAVKLLYSYAHLWCIIDTIRRKRLDWEPTGAAKANSKKKKRWYMQHAKKVLGTWGLGTGLVWVGASIFHLLTDPGVMHIFQLELPTGANFAPMIVLGVVYILVTLRAITGTKG